MKVPANLRSAVEVMIGDLESQRLEVALVPARRGDAFIRAVESTNPDWYRRLCANHTKCRKNKRKRCNHREHDTKIVRPRILGVLRRGLATGVLRSIYAEELLGYAGEIVDAIQAMEAAYEEAELQELGFSRSRLEQMEDAPF